MNIAGFVQHNVAPHLDRAASALESIPTAPMHQVDLMHSARGALTAAGGELDRLVAEHAPDLHATPGAGRLIDGAAQMARNGIAELDGFLGTPPTERLLAAAQHALGATNSARSFADMTKLLG